MSYRAPESRSEVAHCHVRDRTTSTSGLDWSTLHTWGGPGFTRYPTHGLLEQIWALRQNLSAHDAGYVALAESLN